jgi:hypothetical protein
MTVGQSERVERRASGWYRGNGPPLQAFAHHVTVYKPHLPGYAGSQRPPWLTSVREQIRRKQDESKINVLMGFFRFGNLSKAQTFASLQLVADEVLPHVRTM